MSSSLIKNFAKRAIQTSAFPLEWALGEMYSGKDPEICFILGAPRAGTTLLYELLCSNFQAAYFSNLSETFPNIPVTISWLLKRKIRERTGSFNSDYGNLIGISAPAEKGFVFRQWFPQVTPPYEGKGNISTEAANKKLSALCNIMQGPIIIKFLQLSSELDFLKRCFPNSVFLHIERDSHSNIRSIIKLRQRNDELGEVKNRQRRTQWWNHRGGEWREQIDADPITQACLQVELQNKEIREAFRDCSHRYYRLKYEDLCTNTTGILCEISSFFDKSGLRLIPKYVPPQSFNVATPMADPEVDEAIYATLNKLRDRGVLP